MSKDQDSDHSVSASVPVAAACATSDPQATAEAPSDIRRCAALLDAMWHEFEATHGNRGGEYHRGYITALDHAEQAVLALLTTLPLQIKP